MQSPSLEEDGRGGNGRRGGGGGGGKGEAHRRTFCLNLKYDKSKLSVYLILLFPPLFASKREKLRPKRIILLTKVSSIYLSTFLPLKTILTLFYYRYNKMSTFWGYILEGLALFILWLWWLINTYVSAVKVRLVVLF